MTTTHRITVTSLLLVGFALGGCSKPHEVRSVQFFRDHPDERSATMQRCRSEATASTDCENAAAAGLIEAQHKATAAPVFPTRPAQ